jgi:hypothetical protein
MGFWLPTNCNGSIGDCTYTSTPSAYDVSADWTNVGSSPGGNSIQAIGADNNHATNWVVAPTTLGAPNE